MDENVAAMDDREFGFYMRCLGHAWLNDGLPADLDRLARVMSRTREYLDTVWSAVSPCWHTEESRPDRLVNPRQEKQRSEYIALSESRKDAAAARWSKKPTSKAGGMQLHKQNSTIGIARANDMECSPVCILQTPHSDDGGAVLDEASVEILGQLRDTSRSEIISLLVEGFRLHDAEFDHGAHAEASTAELGAMLEQTIRSIDDSTPWPGIDFDQVALREAA